MLAYAWKVKLGIHPSFSPTVGFKKFSFFPTKRIDWRIPVSKLFQVIDLEAFIINALGWYSHEVMITAIKLRSLSANLPNIGNMWHPHCRGDFNFARMLLGFWLPHKTESSLRCMWVQLKAEGWFMLPKPNNSSTNLCFPVAVGESLCVVRKQ